MSLHRTILAIIVSSLIISNSYAQQGYERFEQDFSATFTVTEATWHRIKKDRQKAFIRWRLEQRQRHGLAATIDLSDDAIAMQRFEAAIKTGSVKDVPEEPADFYPDWLGRLEKALAAEENQARIPEMQHDLLAAYQRAAHQAQEPAAYLAKAVELYLTMLEQRPEDEAVGNLAVTALKWAAVSGRSQKLVDALRASLDGHPTTSSASAIHYALQRRDYLRSQRDRQKAQEEWLPYFEAMLETHRAPRIQSQIYFDLLTILFKLRRPYRGPETDVEWIDPEVATLKWLQHFEDLATNHPTAPEVGMDARRALSLARIMDDSEEEISKRDDDKTWLEAIDIALSTSIEQTLATNNMDVRTNSYTGPFLLYAFAYHAEKTGHLDTAREYCNLMIEHFPNSRDLSYCERMLTELDHLVVGKPAPDFGFGGNIKDLDNNPIELEHLKGKVVVLDFWYTTCPPCINELPNLIKLHQAFGDSNEFALVSVSTDNSLADLKRFLDSGRFTMDWTQLHDATHNIRTLYCVRSYPRVFVIDKEGTIAAKDLRGDDLYAQVEDMLR